MLRKVEIKKLFGIYSYAIDLVNGDNYPMRFITGPNGSGKSTLLNLLFALFDHQYEKFFAVEFEELNIRFDEEEFNILQHREYDQDESSDVLVLKDVTLNVTYKKDQKDIETFSVKPGEDWGGMTEIFFKTYPVFFINDERNVYLKSDYHQNHNNDVCARLKMDVDDFRDKLSMNILDLSFAVEVGEAMTKEDYEKEIASLVPQIRTLKKWGLVKPDFEFIVYYEGLSLFLRNYIKEIRAALQSDFIKRVELFVDTINAFTFINKHLEIDKTSGFYFMMDQISRPPLMPEELSSGERHLLLQVYELLFVAPQESLVLLDEPELSMHMYWQINYAKLISMIAETRELQVVVATHSSRIFNQIWEHSVDLYRLTTSQKNKE